MVIMIGMSNQKKVQEVVLLVGRLASCLLLHYFDEFKHPNCVKSMDQQIVTRGFSNEVGPGPGPWSVRVGAGILIVVCQFASTGL